jgi:hypothetical protein
VLALHRVRRRESVGLTWRPGKAPSARSQQTQWAGPDAHSRFMKGLSRKEGSTKAGIDWFMSSE